MQTVSSSDIFANVGRTDEELYVDFSNSNPHGLGSYSPNCILQGFEVITRDRKEKILFTYMSLSWNYGWNFLENMVCAGDEELHHHHFYIFIYLKSVAFI